MSQGRIVLLLMMAVMVLLPFGRLAEIPVLIMAMWGLWSLMTGERDWLRRPVSQAYHVSFGLYFTLMLLASVDSFWPEKSWMITAGSLRFYLAGLVLIKHLGPAQLRVLYRFLVFWLGFLAVDALVQQGLGHDLLGIESYPGRLSGVFGMNVKLGPVLALLLPFVLVGLQKKNKWLRWSLVAVLILVILLSGTRSAWLMMAFVLAMYWWFHVKGRRWLLLLKVAAMGLLASVVLWQVSDDFQDRMNRSVAAFQGDVSGLDFALADRLPIWQTAINMFQTHPINGVGPRAFRKAYADFASDEDVWMAQNTRGLHAHHWFLELLAETGLLGLLLFILMAFKLMGMMWKNKNEPTVWAPSVALLAAFLPVVSLYSLFSSFWSLCLWWVLMLFFVAVNDEE